jgi:hypothetical protein
MGYNAAIAVAHGAVVPVFCTICRGLRLPQRKQLEAASSAGSSNTVTNTSKSVTNSDDPEEVEFQVDQLHLALIKGVCGPPPPQVGLAMNE